MHAVFTEPDSAQLIEEMIAIGLDASPEVVAAQEVELDWVTPARLLTGGLFRGLRGRTSATRRLLFLREM